MVNQHYLWQEEIESVEQDASKQRLSEKSKKKEDLEEKALEKLWRSEVAQRTPKTKIDHTKVEPKKTKIKDTIQNSRHCHRRQCACLWRTAK